MMALAKEIQENNLLRSNGIFNFRPKINLRIEISSYILKTADTAEELIASCKLRHEVFYQEFQQIEQTGVDVDKYDSHFDHLIIVHKASNKIIGTYRLSCSEFSRISYTETEFDLTEVFKLNGPHLELGRACIQKDHRRGATVISLLWRGIVEYMNLSGANILFGCSSIKINNVKDAVIVYKYLAAQGSVMTSNLACAVGDFKMNNFTEVYNSLPEVLDPVNYAIAEKLVPSLLRAYLKFGAKIAGEPAFDKDFDCVDFLTVMKKNEILESLGRRFQLVQ
ncbi:MAG: GNAT family N-acetyltransferase [Bacteriovorax sp.]|nr:GNAT family N-acetyltransferase [Bacteriovorax sp.]